MHRPIPPATVQRLPIYLRCLSTCETQTISSETLAELARVMKPDAVLSVTDDHVKAEELVSALRQGGHFQFSKRNKPTYEFVKKV